MSQAGLDDCGIFYAITGEPFFQEARTSIRSVRALHPDLPITIGFSREEDILARVMDGIPGVTFMDLGKEAMGLDLDMDDGMERSRGVKVHIMLVSPYRYTLFLDSDTYVKKSLVPMFDTLRQGDTQIVTTNEPVVGYPQDQYESLGKADRPQPSPRLLKLSNPSFFNSGVFAFRDTIRDTGAAQRWVDTFATQIRSPAKSNWSRLCDQKAFNDTLKALRDIPRTVLPNTSWNAQCKILRELFVQGRWDDIHIIHCKMVHHLGPDPKTLVESRYISQFWMAEEDRPPKVATS